VPAGARFCRTDTECELDKRAQNEGDNAAPTLLHTRPAAQSEACAELSYGTVSACHSAGAACSSCATRCCSLLPHCSRIAAAASRQRHCQPGRRRYWWAGQGAPRGPHLRGRAVLHARVRHPLDLLHPCRPPRLAVSARACAPSPPAGPQAAQARSYHKAGRRGRRLPARAHPLISPHVTACR
jgi:hypothetical protein